ncbi:hypothetical protein [Actinoplanes sp. NPDC051851]|uniref:hypothetical protein n=1 Tax=Actinoplanes sp. NPDC051851 TaxID=3154753 RepID=UPI00343F81F6
MTEPDRTTEPHDETEDVRPPAAEGPEYDPAGDLECDEAHGVGAHLDVPPALEAEARARRALFPPRVPS